MESIAITSPLKTFLQQPNIETSPAWEFIYGQLQQKASANLGWGTLRTATNLFWNQQTPNPR